MLKTMTMSQAVDYLIDNPVQPTDTPLNCYQNDYADTQGCPAGASWVNYAAPFNDDFVLTYFRTYWSFIPWWYNRMISQPPHILEKINLFRANHFSVQMSDINYAKTNFQHFKTIRQNALGNMKTLVKQVTIDPHMLFFLNGAWNNKWAPDENYARELQELYTVGKGPGSGYTENDVKELISFTGKWKNENEAELKWMVEDETNIDRYDIMRSSNNSDFEKVGTVNAINSPVRNVYTYFDRNLQEPLYYYKLRMIEKGSGSKFSEIVTVRRHDAEQAIKMKVFPNPVRKSFTLSFENNITGSLTVRLMSLDGKEVWKQVVNTTGVLNVVFDLGNKSIPPGVYMLQVVTNGKEGVIKVVVQQSAQ
ncbi:MAG: DUF1800 family protein [Chitinophagaceae bacterium]|nr:DUF1800 family protein [Chitinophagaceae bacterium]